MRVLVHGATGFIGSSLIPYLRDQGHQVTRLVRNDSQDSEKETLVWKEGISLEGFDAVVNLAGEPVASGRWNAAKKEKIRCSRVDLTTSLIEACMRSGTLPKVWVNASAIGYYGDRGDLLLDEASASGEGFLSSVCYDWEKATEQIASQGVRTVCLRIGVVLGRGGGILGKMDPLFRWGLGGVVGSGKQYMSWIALSDLLTLVDFSLREEGLSGPVNAVAPGAVTNCVFTRALGRVLSRPTLFPLPAFAARLLFGEMAEEVLLASTHVSPSKLLTASFPFAYPHLDEALQSIYKE